MPSSSWFYTQGGILIPEGLILGINTGISLPSKWNTFSTADGRYLRGTEVDATAGTTANKGGISVGTSTSGGHNNGPGSDRIKNFGQTPSACANNCYPNSMSQSYLGDHSHSVTITHTPASCNLALVRAEAGAQIFAGAIMFSEIEKADHTALASFHTHGGLLKAAATVGTTNAVNSASNTSSSSGDHNHITGIARTASGCPEYSNATSHSNGGGSHAHSSSTPSITNNMKRAMLRAYIIVKGKNMDGLIGMYLGAGVPPNWSLVAAANDRFIQFSATGDGSTAGNDTISISGNTSSNSHSHGLTGGADTGVCVAFLSHSGSVSHDHSYSGSPSHIADRFFVKFIKYEG
jgi:hypothetical protein